MLTDTIRTKIDALWDIFESGNIANPLEVIEQISILLFIRKLDSLHTLAEQMAALLNKPIAHRIFPEGKDHKERDYDDLRWSRFKNFGATEMFEIVGEHVFPFLRSLENSDYSNLVKEAKFTINNPGMLAKVIDALDELPLSERKINGEMFDYLLSKIAIPTINGQVPTPYQIIDLMVELVAPTPKDIVCDPASIVGEFLVNIGEYLRVKYSKLLNNEEQRNHFQNRMFNGCTLDNSFLRIGSMNLLLHGIESPNISRTNPLSQASSEDEEKYSLILSNPPFNRKYDESDTAKNLLSVVKTKQSGLLFIALVLRLLSIGGRAAIIVPQGFLFARGKKQKMRQILLEQHKLDAVISLPSGAFKPHNGVTTAILVFSKTNSGGTDFVWFYDVQEHGWSLDDKREPLLPQEKLGACPSIELSETELEKNNLPDVLSRWSNRNSTERERPRTAQSFCVPKSEISIEGYDLSFNHYKKVIQEEIDYPTPMDVFTKLETLETEIQDRMRQLKGMIL